MYLLHSYCMHIDVKKPTLYCVTIQKEILYRKRLTKFLIVLDQVQTQILLIFHFIYFPEVAICLSRSSTALNHWKLIRSKVCDLFQLRKQNVFLWQYDEGVVLSPERMLHFIKDVAKTIRLAFL